MQEICNLINLVLNNDKDYDAFLPCFSYRSEPLFNSNEILGFELEKITLEKLFKKNKSPFALLSSLIFPNKNLILDKVELSNAWLHAIIFLKSLNPYTSLWINKKPCIYYESVSSEGSELEQRAITLDYYVNSAIELIKGKPDITDLEIRQGLEGNLCRCTGYQNIVKSIQEAAKNENNLTNM